MRLPAEVALPGRLGKPGQSQCPVGPAVSNSRAYFEMASTNSQDAEQLGDMQSSEDVESHENSNLKSEQTTDNSTPEQEESTNANCGDGKQLQVNKCCSREIMNELNSAYCIELLYISTQY